jgi:hypothetical protein
MLLQPAHYLVSRRTDFGVFQRQIQDLMKVLAVGMRVLPAGARTYFVNGAVVITSQKRARGGVEYVIAIGVEMQVLLDQFGRAQAQMLGNPVNVDIPENGTGGFAAIGAGKAIDFREGLIVSLPDDAVKIFGWSALDTSKQFFKAFAIGKR